MHNYDPDDFMEPDYDELFGKEHYIYQKESGMQADYLSEEGTTIETPIPDPSFREVFFKPVGVSLPIHAICPYCGGDRVYQKIKKGEFWCFDCDERIDPSNFE